MRRIRLLIKALVTWRRRRRTCIMLEACDERILRDIGVRLDWRRRGRAAAVDQRLLDRLDTLR